MAPDNGFSRDEARRECVGTGDSRDLSLRHHERDLMRPPLRRPNCSACPRRSSNFSLLIGIIPSGLSDVRIEPMTIHDGKVGDSFSRLDRICVEPEPFGTLRRHAGRVGHEGDEPLLSCTLESGHVGLGGVEKSRHFRTLGITDSAVTRADEDQERKERFHSSGS